MPYKREARLLTYERYQILTPGSCARHREERLLSCGGTTFSHLDIMVFVFLIFLLFFMIHCLESDGYLGVFFLTFQINLTFRSVLCSLQNCLESMESPHAPFSNSTVSLCQHTRLCSSFDIITDTSVSLQTPASHWSLRVSILKFGRSPAMCPPLQCETEQVNSVSWAESLSYVNAQWFANSEQNCWLFDDLSLPCQCCSLSLTLSFHYNMSCSSPDT